MQNVTHRCGCGLWYLDAACQSSADSMFDCFVCAVISTMAAFCRIYGARQSYTSVESGKANARPEAMIAFRVRKPRWGKRHARN